MGRNVFIETYGCQMNVLDSELVSEKLTRAGFTIVNEVENVDVVLINTCSVRDLAEHKVWSSLGRLGVMPRVKEGRVVVGVLGCMAEREANAIRRRAPHVHILCGPSFLFRTLR